MVRRRRQPAEPAYAEDLARLHHQGYGATTREAAELLVAQLDRAGLRGGTVVDLGCGSGILLARLGAAGYAALGVDISPAMLAIARQQAPDARLVQGSALDLVLPACVAVSAIGEVLAYAFDPRSGPAALRRLLRRVHAALQPGGLLLFDLPTPGRAPAGSYERAVHAADHSMVLRVVEDRAHSHLTRDITVFSRDPDGRFRRHREVHGLRLFRPAEVLAALRGLGFRARCLRGYGSYRFPPGWTGFLARKPG